MLGAINGAHLHQLVAATRERSDPLAGAFGVTGGTYDQVRPDTDALVVATPADERVAVASAAMGLDIPVLVDSPIATSSGDADILIAAAATSAVASGCAEPVLFAPGVALGIERCGSLGGLSHLSIRVLHQEAATPPGGASDPTPTDAVWTVGHHAVALALALNSPDTEAAIEARITAGRDGSEEPIVVAQLTFASGLAAHLELGLVSHAPIWDAQAASPTGVVRIELLPEPLVEVDGVVVDASASPPHPVGERGSSPEHAAFAALEAVGHVAMLQGFADAVAGRGGRLCPLGFGRRVVAVLEACDRSIGRGQPERLQ